MQKCERSCNWRIFREFTNQLNPVIHSPSTLIRTLILILVQGWAFLCSQNTLNSAWHCSRNQFEFDLVIWCIIMLEVVIGKWVIWCHEAIQHSNNKTKKQSSNKLWHWRNDWLVFSSPKCAGPTVLHPLHQLGPLTHGRLTHILTLPSVSRNRDSSDQALIF